MAKKKKYHNPKNSIMGRSDVPLVDRMRCRHRQDVARARERAAMVTTYAASIALYDVKGIGYRRLIRFGQRYMEYEREVYADGVDVGLARCKRRMDEIRMPCSGELDEVPTDGRNARLQDIYCNSAESTQVAITVCYIAIHDEFGYGADTLRRIEDRMFELVDLYAKQGLKYLLQRMQGIGFEVRNGRAQIYLDEEDNVITKKQAEKLEGRK